MQLIRVKSVDNSFSGVKILHYLFRCLGLSKHSSIFDTFKMFPVALRMFIICFLSVALKAFDYFVP